MGPLVRLLILVGAAGLIAACEDAVLSTAVVSGSANYQTTVQTNPLMADIDARSEAWAVPVEISQSLLPAGTTRTDVIALMEGWDFDPIPEGSNTLRITQWFPEPLDATEQAFQGPLVSDGVCGITFLVVAEFDDENRLVRADGWKGESGCL
ncbi:hypothetical protein [Hyphobacterium marinum]|uniref:Lipoprotein n=1 Tax=Hyphobacterium marinum TaxID=3116574 RepID=A0ABU7M0P6_9PROT|nr:hypothetical protein [Hyphobacterium sp. Y6023]MEE2567271.1 hypothetical protein [Hyphobacterium sp. Y6023]